MSGGLIKVPETFRAMPRWWVDGSDWLDALPQLVAEQCDRWGLQLDGRAWHGSNALVVPVLRGGEPLALRLLPPREDVVAESAALTFWDGRGTVRLVEVDPDTNAALLERLDGSTDLTSQPLDEAVVVLAEIMRRLAVPAPTSVRSTAEVAAGDAASFTRRWERLGRPVDRQTVEACVEAAATVSVTPTPHLAVNGDLHHAQVLAGTRLPWIVVDPVLLRGDVQYDLARALWTRLDEMKTDDTIHQHVGEMVDVAGLDPVRTDAWILVRSMSYLLWGLEHGLTTDPVRCRRLLDVFGP